MKARSNRDEKTTFRTGAAFCACDAGVGAHACTTPLENKISLTASWYTVTKSLDGNATEQYLFTTTEPGVVKVSISGSDDPIKFGADLTSCSTTYQKDDITISLTQSDKNFNVVVYNSANESKSYTLTVTFTPAPTLSISDINVPEGNSGTTDATFTVTLSETPTSNVMVKYQTIDKTASGRSDCAGSDYKAVTESDNASITFTPTGPLSQNITVKVCGDTTPEDNEKFFVKISAESSSSVTILKNEAEGTIINDDSYEFNAWEPTLTKDTAKIYTKVVGQDFNLTVGTKDGSNFDGTLCAAAINNSGVPLDGGDYQCKDVNATSASFSWNITRAERVAKINIRSKYNTKIGNGEPDNNFTGYTDNNSSDSFAIKPTTLTLEPSGTIKAGSSDVNITVVDLNGYDENLTVSFASDKSSCKSLFLKNQLQLKDGKLKNQKPVEVGTATIVDSSFTKVDHPDDSLEPSLIDCVLNSDSNSLNNDGKFGCNISVPITVEPYDINVSTATTNPIWTYKSFRSEPKLSFTFEVNATRSPISDLNETAPQLLSNYSSECFAEDTTVLVDATLSPATKSLTNINDINITSQDSGVSITPSAESLSIIIPTTKFSSGKASITLQINSEKSSILTPDDILKMAIAGWTASTASNTYSKITSATDLFFLYGRFAMPSQMVDYAPSATVRAYAEVYATDPTTLPGGASGWVQAPGSSVWWINKLHEGASGKLEEDSVVVRSGSRLDSSNPLANLTGFSASESLPNDIFGGIANIKLNMSNAKNKDQKITLHFNVPSYLWYGSKSFSFAGGSDCSQHPCGTVDIFGTNSTGNIWFGSGESRGDKAIKTVPKGKRVPKINW